MTQCRSCIICMYAVILSGATYKKRAIVGVGQGLQTAGHTCNINHAAAESLEQRASECVLRVWPSVQSLP